MEWPVDILAQLLGWLAWDGASVTFQHLAYLTINNSELTAAARKMPCPLVLDVHIADSTNNQFRIPFYESQIGNIKIDWGDGIEERVSVSQMREERKPMLLVDLLSAWHPYPHPGDYVVRIFPDDSIGPVWLDHLGLGRQYPYSCVAWWRPLRAVRSLGALGIRSLSGLFKKAHHFNLPLSHLDVSNITDLSHMFEEAASFNQPIEKWNVSNVTNMSGMFYGAKSFNQPIGDWNVGQVESMQRMFHNATSFDQPLRDWDVSSVRSMDSLFAGATLFNQPLDKWNVSKVSHMSFMFFNAESFDQDLSSWDVSNVSGMYEMFRGAAKFNRQSISGWKHHPLVDQSDML
jgi:surface protein